MAVNYCDICFITLAPGFNFLIFLSCFMATCCGGDFLKDLPPSGHDVILGFQSVTSAAVVLYAFQW
jgi:hypothetical protein